MKIALVASLGLMLGLLSAVASAADSTSAASSGALYHVVSVKFKDGTTPAQIAEVEKAFVALKTKISGVKSLNWGTNVSPEKRDKGFTHCFVLTFASDKDRDAYLIDPAHKEFVALLGPVLDDVFVIDFQSHE